MSQGHPQSGSWEGVPRGHPVVYLWAGAVHTCGGREPLLDGRPTCPPAAHRRRPFFPSDQALLHRAVHCSATQRARSPVRVKAVTSGPGIGLWERWVNLWAPLWGNPLCLWAGCGELFRVHSEAPFLHRSTHSRGGQNSGSELRKRAYPRFPQPLLLRRHLESPGFASKWGLCTTRRRPPRVGSQRLDPHPHPLSVRCVRLVPGKQHQRQAAAGGGSR